MNVTRNFIRPSGVDVRIAIRTVTLFKRVLVYLKG